MSLPPLPVRRWLPGAALGLWAALLIGGTAVAQVPTAPGAAPAVEPPAATPAAAVPAAPADLGGATAPPAPADLGGVTAPPVPDPGELIAAAAAPAMGKRQLFSPRLIAGFYAGRGQPHVWTEGQARALLGLADASPADGLDPDDFHATAIRGILERGDLHGDEATHTAADILLTDGLLRYLHHLQYGKYDPTRVNRGYTFTEPVDAEVLTGELNAALGAPDLAAAVTGMLPRAPFYERLKAAYAEARNGGGADHGPAIPDGVVLRPGARDPRVPLLRERLGGPQASLAAAPAEPDRYDPALVAAVKAWQASAGLTADGIVGPGTLRALNQHQAPARNLDLLRANLERMRWLWHDLPEDYVFVDLTGFQLQVMRNHQPVWETRTVIGTPKDQTPMFREAMEYVVFNPDWTMPPSIQRKTRGVGGKYRVVDRRTGRAVSGGNVSDVSRYRIVQPPGPNNALGKVKFIFPNGHAVYLHDTPSKHLFAHENRTYSHGCVRVQNPLTLAEQILSVEHLDAKQIDGIVRTGRTRHVHLERHLPVLLYYLTALADERGQVSYRRDVYGRDRALLAVLDEPAHSPRIRFPEPVPASAPAPEAPPATMTTASVATGSPAVAAPPTPLLVDDLRPTLPGDVPAEPPVPANPLALPEPAAPDLSGVPGSDALDASPAPVLALPSAPPAAGDDSSPSAPTPALANAAPVVADPSLAPVAAPAPDVSAGDSASAPALAEPDADASR